MPVFGDSVHLILIPDRYAISNSSSSGPGLAPIDCLVNMICHGASMSSRGRPRWVA
ncbi:hypothetical protein GLOTRDRAFT_100144 [Gloeophyllum trabeum ATCC 11539]|uniref:Uncharacterized protein n=1 Tax=Gloeophyllum trabeum (strain ATCC 11539 / FP-39264 / Madison 617) TaxID=670483 RepID=S7Q4I8_GLOTA|nr:uncharacterized protein GLOTRDRAFT_100144 [Gloeophyllum trabeum ATCC 11539]EPQ54393.1 hypothetical protein GLOTRDRAFT_100144 [Gloeophyllum trabeum ATCC 11539]